MEVALTVRDLDFADLPDLDWSGGPEHLNAVAAALQDSLTGGVAMLGVALPNGRLIAKGGVDLRKHAGRGELWMLAVHEAWQSLGVGTLLIGALEDRVRQHGLGVARLGVEHDNPRAAALYRRLGYRAVGSELDGWPVAGGRTYITVCTILERSL
ncbi:hypothetical protein GCM10009841_36680 [Microlunatus panaciterrae]|uniref:Ribosomal protein S18 acetylase RimI-like enzyme n=1 Tax=Microlunatus panaciterrae TaxID=400768 RepID=A0ABS2RH42_9ACTN|nr:GNAT family N-acetyltransferase [Microlunatus panaciterrae]MBM7798329.1 ribosomal protein S18 acetylase RimI-like enzyme [Microlunatus panaciterrae]